MEKPLISIIIPVYNTKEFLTKCVHSLLLQTVHSFEMILIDDGSTDGSSQLCDELALEDNRIIVIHSVNRGASYARNKGLEIAKGDYIAFVDSDDWVTIDYLDSLLRQYDQQNIDLSIVGYKVVTGEESNLPNAFKEHPFIEIISSEEALVNIFKSDRYKGYLWNKLFKTEMIRKYHLKFDSEIKIWEDLLFCCQYLMNTNQVSISNKTCYLYVSRKGSATSLRNDANEKTKLIAAKKIAELDIHVADFVDETKKRLIIEYIYFILIREFKNGIFNPQHVSDILHEINRINRNLKLSLKFRLILFILRKYPSILYWIYKMKGQLSMREGVKDG